MERVSLPYKVNKTEGGGGGRGTGGREFIVKHSKKEEGVTDKHSKQRAGQRGLGGGFIGK